MKKLIFIIFCLLLLGCTPYGCAPHQQETLVFVPKRIQTAPYYYEQVIIAMNALIDENAQIRKQYYLLWINQLLRDLQTIEMEDLPE